MKPASLELARLGEWVELLRLKKADLIAIPADLEEPMLELSSLLDVLQDASIGVYLRPHARAGLLHHLVGAVQAEDVCAQRIQHALSIFELALETVAEPVDAPMAATLVALCAALLRAAHEELNSDLLPVEHLAADIDDLLRRRSPSSHSVWTVGTPLRLIRRYGERLAGTAHILDQVGAMLESIANGSPLSGRQIARIEEAASVYSMSSERLLHRSVLAMAKRAEGVTVPARDPCEDDLQAGEAVLF
ncbi:MAG: hypothetical protein R2762_25275 [Bryobacteraceae bacterium]